MTIFYKKQLIYNHAGLKYKKIDYVTGKTTIYVYGQGTEPSV